jgi:hypothetical protein
MGVGMGRPIGRRFGQRVFRRALKRSRQALSRGIQRQKRPSTGSQIEIQGRRTLMECRNMVSGRCTVARPLRRICATRPRPPAVRAGDRLCSSSKVSPQPGMTGAGTLARPVPHRGPRPWQARSRRRLPCSWDDKWRTITVGQDRIESHDADGSKADSLRRHVRPWTANIFAILPIVIELSELRRCANTGSDQRHSITRSAWAKSVAVRVALGARLGGESPIRLRRVSASVAHRIRSSLRIPSDGWRRGSIKRALSPSLRARSHLGRRGEALIQHLNLSL